MISRCGALIALALSLIDAGESRAQAPTGLLGAWRIVQITTKTPDSTWTDNTPQPGLYLFTAKHFSLMLIPQDTPRPPLPDNASAEQRLAAYENFVADAGSYEASDSVLIMRNVIAKEPYAMNGGAGSPYRYQLKGDSLTLTFRGAWARDAGGELTYRLVRLRVPDRPTQGEQATRNPFQGAWLITQTSVTGPSGDSTNENPEPGLYVFTERHFSNMLIPGLERKTFSAEPTHQERLAAYDNFIADGGTYQYTDSTLTARNLIAKIPNVMPLHSTGALTYRWRFDGDVLVLTLRGGWAPPNGEITYRLSRLE